MLIFRVQRLTGFPELCFEGIGGSYVQSHSKTLYNYSVFKIKIKRSITLLCLQWVSLCLLTCLSLCPHVFQWFGCVISTKASFGEVHTSGWVLFIKWVMHSQRWVNIRGCPVVMQVLSSVILLWDCFAPESMLDVRTVSLYSGRCLSNRILWSSKNCKGVLFKYTALYWLIGITESIPSTVNLKKKTSIFYSFKKYF